MLNQKIKSVKRNSLLFTCVIILSLILFLLVGIDTEYKISRYYRTISGTCTLSNLNISETIFDDGAHYFTLYYSNEDVQYFNTSEPKSCYVIFPQKLAINGSPTQTITPLRGFYFGIGATILVLISKEIYIYTK